MAGAVAAALETIGEARGAARRREERRRGSDAATAKDRRWDGVDGIASGRSRGREEEGSTFRTLSAEGARLGYAIVRLACMALAGHIGF